MNDPRTEESGKKGRWLPFFIEFVKFSAGFAGLIALGLIALRFASATAGY